MSNKDFVLKLVQLVKGTLIGKVILALVSGGFAVLGASPFFDKYISAFLSQYLSVNASDPSVPIGLVLIATGVGLTIWERRNILAIELSKMDSNRIEDELREDLKENQFIAFKSAIEATCLDTIRRLIEKHHDIDYNPNHVKDLGKRALYGSNEATLQYIDAVLVGNSDEKVKIDFLIMLGDATGQPIIYKFLKQYQELLKRAESEGFQGLIKGTPLYQAYENVTHPAFLELRKKAYWEDFV
ncbi:MAG: hypothetical protein ABJ000_03875 [Saccharospirillum sp.]|uniref:hypothetical protein n=1 Tax=Saccharospirillum sp. TaxID=2033801 RepID=UPI003298DFFA